VPIVSGGGAAFNGGTITHPLVIAPNDPNAIPLQIRASLAAQNVDFFSVYDIDGARDMVAVDDFGSLNALFFPTFHTDLQAGTGDRIIAAGGVLASISSGALPTVALVSGTGTQIVVAHDVDTVTPVTFNPGAATTAACTVALSPDNVTYTTVGIETEPAGVALDGTIHLVKVRVPAGWYLKLTVNAQATLGLTTYY
jgi:hypothetical protein